jgi:hypothetical protein
MDHRVIGRILFRITAAFLRLGIADRDETCLQRRIAVRLTPGTSFTDAYLAAIANNSTGAGIHGVVIDTATRTTAGGLYVGDGSRNVFVYDNTFIDEPNNIATGSGTGIYMVDLGPGSSNVFIDGNTFNHVPQGIASRIGDVTSIRITHNHFTNWRAISAPAAE